MTITQEFSKSHAVEIRQAANVLGGMAEDYSMAIQTACKISDKADVRDMVHKREALLVAKQLLLTVLGARS